MPELELSTKDVAATEGVSTVQVTRLARAGLIEGAVQLEDHPQRVWRFPADYTINRSGVGKVHRFPRATPWRDRVQETAWGCLLWLGRIDKGGYGRWGRADLGQTLAHRVVYVLERGSIPDGLTLDHLCRITRCVNPDHLEPVTLRENLLRGNSFQGINSRKTHCIHGHPFDEANTYVYVNRQGRPNRACRTCARAASKRQQARKGGE